MPFRNLETADLQGKRALVRVDFNVPMEGGRISDDTRLRAALPTIHFLSEKGAKVVLLAHFDRPKGRRVPEMSLKPVAKPLSALIEQPVAFADDCVGAVAKAVVDGLEPGGVALLENLRFHPGEENNDPAFARELAALGDLYVDDAFSAAHRAHASTEGIARLLPAYPGLAMQRELEALDAALGNPRRPVIGIVGGAKVSTKLDLLNNLVAKLQFLAIGGGMANTFRFAQGYEVGASLCEKDMADTAREIIERAKAAGCELILPNDAVVADKLEPGVSSRVVQLEGGPAKIKPDDKIFDVGPNTIARIVDAISECRTLIWNGPLGVFEVPPFDAATAQVARHAGKLALAGKLVAVAGGGDTVSALNAAGVTAEFTFVSTAGGAFLEWMEGKELPGVAALGA
jgi:phosphoglycerate kinase